MTKKNYVNLQTKSYNTDFWISPTFPSSVASNPRLLLRRVWFNETFEQLNIHLWIFWGEGGWRDGNDGRLCFHRCVSVQGGGGYLPWMGEGYLLRTGGGAPTLDRGKGYLPWMGEGVPTFIRGRGYLPWMGEGVPTLDRLCRGQYTSCGFPQEDLLVFVQFYFGKNSRLASLPFGKTGIPQHCITRQESTPVWPQEA